MSTFTIDEDAPILVEFTPRAPQAGVQEVMRGWPPSPAAAAGNIAEQSAKAIDSAMNTIHNMARRVSATAKSLPIAERPSQIEVEFGLKLDAAAGAVVAQAGVEASLNVKLTWQRKEASRPVRPARARHS
jgi:hypothetical protein